MWQKFKDYLVKKGKSSINKQELEQEIKNIQSQGKEETQKPSSKAPWIIGGSIVGGVVVVGLVAILIKNNRLKSKKQGNHKI